MGFMGKWHRVQTAEASAVYNDVSAFGTDEVRMGHGVEYESRISLRGVYTVASVGVCHINISEGEYGMWWWD